MHAEQGDRQLVCELQIAVPGFQGAVIAPLEGHGGSGIAELSDELSNAAACLYARDKR